MGARFVVFGIVALLLSGGCRRARPQARTELSAAATSSSSAGVTLSSVQASWRPAPQLSAGHAGSCAVAADGVIKCWGIELGSKTQGRGPDPLQHDGRFVQVARENVHVCARTAAGDIWCAGYNDDGQLGATPSERCKVGRSGDERPCSGSLLQVKGLPKAADVVVGSGRSCAITQQGEVYCWGLGIWGMLGFAASDKCDSGLVCAKSPRLVPGLKDIRRLALGSFFSCALGVDGTVWCWGANTSGQLGRGSYDRRRRWEPQPNQSEEIPTRVTGLYDIVDVAAGEHHACAISIEDSKTRLWCWGNNANRELGVETPRGCDDKHPTENPCSTMPVHVPLPPGSHNSKLLAVAGNTSCALQESGELYCWGKRYANWPGISAHCAEDCWNEPSRVSGLAALVEVANGGDHLCAATRDGAVFCWGESHTPNQLGFRSKPGACDDYCIEPPTVVPAIRVTTAG